MFHPNVAAGLALFEECDVLVVPSTLRTGVPVNTLTPSRKLALDVVGSVLAARKIPLVELG